MLTKTRKESALMSERIIDIHIHPFSLITEDHLLMELEKAGVDLGVLLALDVDPQDLDRPQIKEMVFNRLLDLHKYDATRVIEELKVFLEMVKTDDEEVARLVKNHPDRFIGFGSIDLSKDDTYVEEKIKAIDKLNLKGIKLIPTLQFFNPVKAGKKLRKVFEYCEKNGKVILFHSGCDPFIWEEPHFSQDANPKHLLSIVRDFEKVPVIVAHMGCYSARMPGIWLDEALELGRENENVWFDIAAVIYLVTREKFVDKIRRTVGLDRVLFGSDYPAVNGVSIRSMVDEVRNSRYLTEEEKAKVLGLNAVKLLDLG
jgi:hypothetical protein